MINGDVDGLWVYGEHFAEALAAAGPQVEAVTSRAPGTEISTDPNRRR